jgi:TQXA domain-containing protein/LPXTG-motif cell wall-anchored protein
MFTVGRRQSARLAAAALVTGLLAAGAMAGAGSAAADSGKPVPSAGGATATLKQLKHYETATIRNSDGSTEKVAAALLSMKTSDGYLSTYCIDIHHPTGTGAEYTESAWDATSLGSNPDAGKIKWVLENGYPQVNDLSALAKESGAGTLNALDAAAGTQVAIWHFSDHVNVTANKAKAEKLAKYLINHAQSLSEPQASLTLTPPAVSGKSGTKLGPLTVHTDGPSAEVSLGNNTPAGVKLVDAAGNPVSTAADGAQLYFDVPAGTAPGTATMMVQSTTTVPIGRAFTGTWKHQAAQTLILAGSSASTVSAQASATWASQGAIPALSAAVDCAKSGVDVTASNSGDQDFTFELAGQQYTVAPGKSQTITVPVKEDQQYSITVTGPNGFSKSFTGVLDCKVSTGSGGGVATASPAPAPSAASGGADLAETGSSSATPVIAGIAVVLVLVGGGTVFFVRKRKSGSAS